jgi:hypothetical protein
MQTIERPRERTGDIASGGLCRTCKGHGCPDCAYIGTTRGHLTKTSPSTTGAPGLVELPEPRRSDAF